MCGSNIGVSGYPGLAARGRGGAGLRRLHPCVVRVAGLRPWYGYGYEIPKRCIFRSRVALWMPKACAVLTR